MKIFAVRSSQFAVLVLFLILFSSCSKNSNCSNIIFDTTPLASSQSTLVKLVYHNINDTSYPVSRVFILEANTKEVLHPIYFNIY